MNHRASRALRYALLVASFPFALVAWGDELVISVHGISADGVGEPLGTVIAADTSNGLELIPNLKGLPPGEHGFHIHEKPSCEQAEKEGKMVAGLAAGGHYDPEKTGAHKGPEDAGGHLGDLPVLIVNDRGQAQTPVLAPRLKVADIKGRSLMIHAHGDNYSDDPKPLGGGGPRVACGIIE